MSEDLLTGFLVDNLKKGGLKKLTRIKEDQTVEMRREVGNNSFVADIFISLQKEATGLFNNKNTQFIAIEVKIKDWKQGLYQAWRYKSFAEKSYLAIYDKYAKNVDLEMFKEYGIGLIIFNEKQVKVIVKPTTSKFKEETHSFDVRSSLWGKLQTMETV